MASANTARASAKHVGIEFVDLNSDMNLDDLRRSAITFEANPSDIYANQERVQ